MPQSIGLDGRITIYSLGQAITLPIAGKISDQFGRRRVFYAALESLRWRRYSADSLTTFMCSSSFEQSRRSVEECLLPLRRESSRPHFGRDRDRALGMFGDHFRRRTDSRSRLLVAY